MKLQLREYQSQDFESLAKIVRKTWHYDEFCTPITASKLANVFLSSCLTNYVFSRVAVYEGKVVGIILVKNKQKYNGSFSQSMKQIKSILSLYASKEGRKASKIFENVSGIDKQLLKKCPKSYPSELALFAVDAAYRGLGIGKQLYHSALEYIDQNSLNPFYLFTDTSCDYQFYEHQGMIRLHEMKHTFKMDQQQLSMNFFIYEHDTTKKEQIVL